MSNNKVTSFEEEHIVIPHFLLLHHIFSFTDDKILSSTFNLLIRFYLLAHFIVNKRYDRNII